MKFTVITLFPELIRTAIQHGLLGQAQGQKGIVTVDTINPRDFTSDAHHSVDDRAFGGSDGMVLKYAPLAQAVDSLSDDESQIVVLTPQGKPWTQEQAKRWAKSGGHKVLICGRYAGIDQRFILSYADEEISLGDFILNGGEVAALALIESVTRLLPNGLGNNISALRDSFSEGLLECPQFTRPREMDGLRVPEVLLSGNHVQIAKFEKAIAVLRTAILRPDLPIEKTILNQSIKDVLDISKEDLQVVGISSDDLDKLKEYTNGKS